MSPLQLVKKGGYPKTAFQKFLTNSAKKGSITGGTQASILNKNKVGASTLKMDLRALTARRLALAELESAQSHAHITELTHKIVETRKKLSLVAGSNNLFSAASLERAEEGLALLLEEEKYKDGKSAYPAALRVFTSKLEAELPKGSLQAEVALDAYIWTITRRLNHNAAVERARLKKA